MAGVALLARDLGYTVSGSDQRLYPPTSTLLAEQGIAVMEGYTPAHLEPVPDLVIIGNALSRGNPEVEAVLDRGLCYTSGAQWVAEHLLRPLPASGRPAPRRWVLAVAGTHGKTTTAAMLAWMLEHAGLEPGFLIGGVPENFGVSARLGEPPFFVIEGDEYDTAFFDKRSKFVHYRPRTVVLNNLEYDHADIFSDVDAIKLQFHHLIRTVPSSGLVVVNARDRNLANTLGMGCWSAVERFQDAAGWSTELLAADGSSFKVLFRGEDLGTVKWDLIGNHNVANALAALAAARHAGVPVPVSIAALADFRSVRRRLEVRGSARGITIYDDFAHHPTAIAATLQALRARVGDARIIAVVEPRSNTMRLGVHRDTLGGSLALADKILLLQPAGLNWNIDRVTAALGGRGRAYGSVDEILSALLNELRPADHVLVMSNGDFENIHARLMERLRV